MRRTELSCQDSRSKQKLSEILTARSCLTFEYQLSNDHLITHCILLFFVVHRQCCYMRCYSFSSQRTEGTYFPCRQNMSFVRLNPLIFII